jgi:hypothetical protein
LDLRARLVTASTAITVVPLIYAQISMATLASILDDHVLTATLQKGLYALAACSVIGTAAYIGYRAAEPGTKHLLHSRHPDSNEQVSANGSRFR